MRAIWKGAVSFGLVNVPVRLFTATQEHDIRFHQVHRADGGRIRQKRVCQVCGEEVSYDQLAKGYEAEDGRLVVLTDEDFEGLPIATGHEIDVVSFVPIEQIDPIMYGKAYYLEPDSKAAKAYTLLREALSATERVAVVKVALRQRESLALLRVRENVIMLQTLLWPDEIRAADFPVLADDVELRPQELRMAASLVESMATDFEPDEFEDDYASALRDMVEAKLDGVAPPVIEAPEESASDVVDLLSALQASVDRARTARGEKPAPTKTSAASKTTAAKAPAAKKAPAKAPAKKSASTKPASTTKKAAQKTVAAAKKSAAAETAAKKAPAAPRKTA
jgi:DNA end-binding protein Ku